MKTNAFIRWSGRAKMAVPVLLALFLAVGPAGSSFAQDDPVEFYADIRYCSCPNPLNLLAMGILPVVVSVAEGYNVYNIDLSSIMLEGIYPKMTPPLQPQFRDVTTPYSPEEGNCDDCTAAGPDGEVDLLLFFDAEDVVGALPPGAKEGDCIFLEVTGQIGTSSGSVDFTAGDNVLIYSGKKKKQ